jgi:hypothetical protein
MIAVKSAIVTRAAFTASSFARSPPLERDFGKQPTLAFFQDELFLRGKSLRSPTTLSSDTACVMPEQFGSADKSYA